MTPWTPPDLLRIRRLFPGILVCTVTALAATFLSEHYGGPQLLYALLIGLSLHFLSQQESTRAGISFCGKTVLRLGVALLGLRITCSHDGDGHLPFLLLTLNWSPVPSGIFLGATIHDVAQVVAAGMMMGQGAGDAATIVKLFRVLLLMPGCC